MPFSERITRRPPNGCGEAKETIIYGEQTMLPKTQCSVTMETTSSRQVLSEVKPQSKVAKATIPSTRSGGIQKHKTSGNTPATTSMNLELARPSIAAKHLERQSSIQMMTRPSSRTISKEPLRSTRMEPSWTCTVIKEMMRFGSATILATPAEPLEAQETIRSTMVMETFTAPTSTEAVARISSATTGSSSSTIPVPRPVISTSTVTTSTARTPSIKTSGEMMISSTEDTTMPIATTLKSLLVMATISSTRAVDGMALTFAERTETTPSTCLKEQNTPMDTVVTATISSSALPPMAKSAQEMSKQFMANISGVAPETISSEALTRLSLTKLCTAVLAKTKFTVETTAMDMVLLLAMVTTGSRPETTPMVTSTSTVTQLI